jgi:hypothetical protein
MDYDRIRSQLDNSPSIKLLRSKNAPLILSFLHRQFKEANRITIAESELEEKLEDYLEFLRESNIEDYKRSPKEYLNEWCANELLSKKFEAGSDDPLFALTVATEKAIGWLEDLEKREFVGTESRFLQIFSLLKDIRDYSTTDVETRIAQLEQDRDRIQQEIEQIQQSGAIERYNPTQLQEWFLNANQIARQLIADFRQVEENFRELARTVQNSQIQKDTRKGTIVERVLDSDEALKESDQGRSFYAFWTFLMSESKQQELRLLLDTVYSIEELSDVTQKQPLLRRIERRLLDAGGHIVQSNNLLAAHLRRVLDDRNLNEHRRIAELISNFQTLAIQMQDKLSNERNFLELEGKPVINLPMSRPLHPLEELEEQRFELLDFSQLPDRNSEEENEEFYNQFYLDESRLEQNIARSLEHRSQITLSQLLELYPVQQGLSEIVAYLSIATKFEPHQINEAIAESIVISSLKPEQQFYLTLPQVIFKR